jgi:FKBP-type peptidyl-prolyl cis-trans isomerase
VDQFVRQRILTYSLPAMLTRAILLAASAALLSSCSTGAPKCSPVSLAQAGTVGDTIVLVNGLEYIETSVGTGTAAAWCQTASIQYDAYLTDGTLWDTSAGQPTPYVLIPGMGEVQIVGLEQGVIGMRPGGQRRLIVPPQLGFGNNLIRFTGNTTTGVLIPPESTLIFDVTLVSAGTP